METLTTTRVIRCIFNNEKTQNFQLSCPFPVQHIETSIATKDTGGLPGVVTATSNLVDNEAVGMFVEGSVNMAGFQSRFHRFRFSQPRVIQGRYDLTVDIAHHTGDVILIVVLHST